MLFRRATQSRARRSTRRSCPRVVRRRMWWSPSPSRMPGRGKWWKRSRPTRLHPFFVEGKGFVPAGALAIGNSIVTRAGPALVVKSVEWLRRPEDYEVYNFVVEDDHTYFVDNTNGGAWVHNVNCDLFGNPIPNVGKTVKHHIATNKSATWTHHLQRELNKGGLSMEHPANIVDIPEVAHTSYNNGFGHPDAYHRWVGRRLRAAAGTKNLEEANQALIDELRTIGGILKGNPTIINHGPYP